QTCCRCDIDECPVALIPIQLLCLAAPRESDIHEPVIIIIRERADEPLIGSARSALQPRRIGNLCKGAIAIVFVEAIRAFEILYEQVQPAVVVVIDPKTAATAIHRGFDPRGMSDVFKRPIATAAEE